MRNLEKADVARFRRPDFERALYGGRGDSGSGVFGVPSPIDKRELTVVASDGSGWDHVSVSRRDRIPRYEEMVYVRALFFDLDETVMELHMPESEHINVHERTLHLWRPHDVEIPRPPAWMVGPHTAPAGR